MNRLRLHIARPGTVFAALALITVGGQLVAAPAHATTALLTCSGSYQTKYEPGLTYTAQPVRFRTSSTYSCMFGGAVTSGSASVKAHLPSASCADLLSSVNTGTTTVKWNTGETTTYSWSSTAVNVTGTIVTTTVGTVTAGKYLGAQVQRVTSSPSLDVLDDACASDYGLRDESGSATLALVL